MTSVNLTNLNTPSTEAYGGSVPPASKNIIRSKAVKKNETGMLFLWLAGLF